MLPFIQRLYENRRPRRRTEMRKTGRFARWVVGSGLALALAAFSVGQTADPVSTSSGRYDGKRFRQPEPLTIRFSDWAKRQWSGHRGPWRKFTYTPPGPTPAEYACDGDLRVTFVNHATLLIQMDGVNILTDPTWAKRSVPVVGRTRRRPPGLRFDELPKIDAVLVSHNHQDHMDLPTLRRLAKNFDPVVYTGLGNARFLAKNGVTEGHDLDWWQSVEIAPGITVTAVPARHHSGRSLFDKDRTLWCGFVVKGPSGSVYFAGDTGYGSHFEEIGRRFPNLRLAILPIGGFKPIWYMQSQHIGPEAALQALKDLGAASMIPMHFGTFPNGDEAETEAVEVLEAAIANSPDLSRRVSILDNGQSVDVAPALPRDPPHDSTLEASVLSGAP
jgi:L-ascorbate metabolism protein UlaG (beta-lactamase superfamily)